MTEKDERDDTHEDLILALVEYEHDALAAHEAAAERLDDAAVAARVDDFRVAHARCLEALGTIASSLGLKMPDGDVSAALAGGKMVLAGVVGDRTILRTLLANEGLGEKAYEEAAASARASEATRDLAREALADTRDRRRWLADAVDRLGRTDEG